MKPFKVLCMLFSKVKMVKFGVKLKKRSATAPVLSIGRD